MGCCSGLAQKRYSKWLAIAPISVPRSASSACSTPGIRKSNFIPMSTVSFPLADSPGITAAGFDPTHASSFRSDRLLQRAPHLESESPTSSPCPLCRSRWRTLPGSPPLDSIPPTLLPSHRCTAARLSWQVRRRPQVCLPTPPTAPGRRTRTARPSQVLRGLVASALPQRLDRLLQTTLRRTRVRPAVSRPLYPPRCHLQPSLGRIRGRPGYLSLA